MFEEKVGAKHCGETWPRFVQKDHSHKIDVYPQDQQFFDHNGLTKSKLEILNFNFLLHMESNTFIITSFD